MLKEGSKVNLSKEGTECLNPYFNGTCSKRNYLLFPSREQTVVLILILMEHAQRETYKDSEDNIIFFVLILILMEHAQRDTSNALYSVILKS